MIGKGIRGPSLALLATAALVAGAQSPASAGLTIDFDGQTEQNGTGFGAIWNVLTLQQQGDATTESGAVSWNGTSDDETVDAKNTSQTQLSGILAAAMGVTIGSNLSGATFGIVFNISDPGNVDNNELLLQEFNVTFQGNNGGTLFGPGTFTPSSTDPHYEAGPPSGLRLAPVGSNGTGTAGWLFNVTLGAAEATSFFSAADNHLGMFVTMERPISDATDGQDNFYLVPGSATPAAAAPEPSTLITGVTGVLIGLGYAWRRRKSGLPA